MHLGALHLEVDFAFEETLAELAVFARHVDMVHHHGLVVFAQWIASMFSVLLLQLAVVCVGVEQLGVVDIGHPVLVCAGRVGDVREVAR